MDNGTIAIIATALLAGLGVFGLLPLILKYAKAIKESVDVLTAVTVALSDGKIDADEVADIKAEVEEAKAVWKNS